MNRSRVRRTPFLLRVFSLMLAINLFLGQCVPGYILQSLAGPDDNLVGGLTIGGHSGEQEFESFGDVILPLCYLSESGMLFANPRVSVTTEDQQEINLGLGYRYLLGGKMILGVNTFYDGRWTEGGNFFDQMGVGIEFLSEWVDARANWYIADDDEELADTREHDSTVVETIYGEIFAQGNSLFQEYGSAYITTHQIFNRYESALDGFDAEIGVKVPCIDDYAETRLFVGYQTFSNPYMEGRYEGMKGRVEIRALPGLTLDAEYFEEDELNNDSEYYVGARLRVPFDLAAIGQGENPFAGATEEFKRGSRRPLESRMAEMVIRDMKVRRAQSDYIEDVAKRTVGYKFDGERVVLTDTATFVDADNATGIENGTHERPYTNIQEGVDSAFGDKTVVVDDRLSGTGIYEENVVLSDGVEVYGKYPGFGDKYYGDIMPVVDGGKGNAPTFEMANDTALHYMHIKNTGVDPLGPKSPVAWDKTKAGIVAAGVNNLLLDGVVVSDTGYGAVLTNVGSFKLTVNDSQFINNRKGGLVIYSRGSDGIFDAAIAGSTFANNEGDGGYLRSSGLDAATVTISDSIFNGNAGSGLYLEIVSEFGSIVDITDVVAEDNDRHGIAAVAISIDGSSLVTLSGLVVNDNYYMGLGAESLSVYGNSTLLLSDSRASGNDIGFELFAETLYAGSVSVGASNVVSVNNADAGLLSFAVSHHGDVSLSLNDVVVSSNGIGSFVRVDSVRRDALFEVNNFTAEYNDVAGMFAMIEAYSNTVINVDNVRASNNQVDSGVVLVSEAGEDLKVNLSDINASYNGNDGLQVVALGFSNVLVNVDNMNAHGNGQHGIAIEGMSLGDFDVTLSDVTSVSNMDYNVFVYADAGGVANIGMANIVANYSINGVGVFSYAMGHDGASVVMNNVQANGNGSDGVWASVKAYHMARIDMDDIVASDNGANGVWAYAYSYHSDAKVNISDVEANNNSSNGVYAYSYAYSYSSGSGPSIDMHDVTANGNGFDGVSIYTVADDETKILLGNIEANDNGYNGIDVYATSGTNSDVDVQLTLSNIAANNNGVNGLYIYAYSHDNSSVVSLEASTVTNNVNDGIEVYAFGKTNTTVIMRTNSIFGNAGYDLDNLGANVIDAQSNWWGTATPAAGQFSGAVNTNNALLVAP